MGIDQHTVDKTVEIRKNYGTKLPDAIIAATAICHGRTWIADHASDIARIKELKQLYPNRI